MTLQPGAHLAGYRIESQIGRGGMGTVYLATDERLGRKVALKILSPALAEDVAFRDRFVAESRIAASLDHPNIVPVFEAGDSDGRLFIAMRFVDGTDLARLIAERGPLPLDLALSVVQQVAGALDTAHTAGLVHRDVKPGNVLLTETDAGVHAYLVDFGLTKQVGGGTNMTRTGQFVGSIEYVAPEQIEGRAVDARTDIYALGCLVYECLAGTPPFHRGSDMATLTAHTKDPPPSLLGPRPDLPAGMDVVVGRALTKDPQARFASAGQFAMALTEAAHADAGSDAGRGLLVAELRRDVGTPVDAAGPDDAAADARQSRTSELFQRVVRDAVSRHGGAEVERSGSAIGAVFPTVDQALACALTISAATQAQAAADPESGLRVAVGVHADQGAGATPQPMPALVGVAHGIASQAGSGEVVASETVVRQARPSTRIAFGRRTTRRIDGLAQPLGLVRVEGGSGLQQPSAGRRRVAIVALGAGAIGLAGLAWLGASGGPGGSASPTPPTSVAAVPTPSATPELVERVAFAVEEIAADTESCGLDASFLPSKLHLVAPDGSDQMRLKTGADVWARAPAWSADGTSLAFWGSPGDGDVAYTVAANGSDPKQLMANDPNLGGVFYGRIQPLPSSDGSTIAFVKNGSLVIVDVTDRAITAILGQPFSDQPVEQPSASPIAPGPASVDAADRLSDGGFGLIADGGFWKAAADGTRARRTGSMPDLSIDNPRWSPDGTRVLFQGRPKTDGDTAPGPWDVYLVREDGSGLQRLTSDPGNDIQPGWSPDGERVVFASDRSGTYEILVMDISGSNQTPITDSPEGAAACWPAWARTTAAELPQPSPSPAPGATPVPEVFERGRLEPGSYMTDDLAVRTRFAVGDGWTGYIATPDEISFQDADDRFVELTIARLQTGYDPPCYPSTEGATAPELKLLGPDPRDVIDWLAGQPHLKVSAPTPVNVAGMTGLQVELAPAGPLATTCPDAIGNRLHLFQAGNDSVWVRDGQKLRVTALDVRGTTVTILAGAPEPAFAGAMSRLQPTIDSLDFPE